MGRADQEVVEDGRRDGHTSIGISRQIKYDGPFAVSLLCWTFFFRSSPFASDLSMYVVAITLRKCDEHVTCPD